jgi:hypothetical protein
MKRIASITGIVVSSIYLLNFSFGFVELPDYLPIIGNLDEFAAAALLIASLKHFGIDLTDFLVVKKRSGRAKG